MKVSDSSEPVVAKDTELPQAPVPLAGVTAPLVLQSHFFTLVGGNSSQCPVLEGH